MIIRTLKSPVFTDGVIVDNEISNNLDNGTGQWDYEKADIVCCGILALNEIVILFREKEDDIEQYKEKIKTALQGYAHFYAFNRNMEYGNFKGFLGKEYDVREIKAFNGKSWSKERFVIELVQDKLVVHECIPIDPLENDSKQCIDCYAKGDYEKIITHNIVDLIKQAHLLKHKEYLLNKYKNMIDKNGFLLPQNIKV